MHHTTRRADCRLAALAAALLLLPSCGFGDDAALPVPAEIVASITPGKPGAPTETVKASWDGKSGTLAVRRGSEGAVAEEAQAMLSEAEYRKLWEIVRANNLQHFQPAKREGQVFDFGERRLEIVAGGAAARTAVQWETPLTNESKVDPLLRELSRLAGQKAASVSLAYFPRP